MGCLMEMSISLIRCDSWVCFCDEISLAKGQLFTWLAICLIGTLRGSKNNNDSSEQTVQNIAEESVFLDKETFHKLLVYR